MTTATAPAPVGRRWVAARRVPPTVQALSLVMALQVALMTLTTALTVLRRDELLAAWAATRNDPAGTLQEPALVPVAVSLLVVLAPLAWVLVALLRRRARWARTQLTALAVLFGTYALVLAVTRDALPLFSALALVAGLGYAGVLALLWHPATSRWLAARR